MQTNFGGLLTVDERTGRAGAGAILFERSRRWTRARLVHRDRRDRRPAGCSAIEPSGKAADAGPGAVGSPITHGSGDYVLAFSTNENLRQKFASDDAVETRTVLRDDRLSPLFQAVREATEEAVINSLLKATTTTGRDGHHGGSN